jgi:hypothetical protein
MISTQNPEPWVELINSCIACKSFIAHRTKLLKTGKPILEKDPKQGYICNLKKSDGDKNKTIPA